MASRETAGQNVDPGVISRIVQGVRYAISGVGPTNWFGPQQPLAPQAQDKVEGRQFDFPVGFNLRIQPRSGEPVGFDTLRGLADGYDLLRLVIETRKDQIEAFDWEIVPYEKKANAEALKGEIKRVTDFLQMPDKEHDWPQWLRMQVEDMLVIDAIAVYPRMNRGGELYGFELIDPATLVRKIDDMGRTPLPPDPAYQQVLKGIPAADYSADQLIYTMRNPRTNRIYGYSPVEQVMMTVNIAIRRQLSQLDAYTQGNIPEAIAQVPETWTMQQITEFQTWWDSVLEGNTKERRKMKFVPSLDNIVFPKEMVLKDQYDEWLARIICFAFSTTPSALIQQVNRASGEQMADTAKEEGLMPLLKFLEGHMTRMIRRYLKAEGVRFRFKVVNKIDPVQQATVHKTYIEAQVITPDEAREDLGKEAMTPEQREEAFPSAPAMPFGPDGLPIEPKLGPDGKPLPPDQQPKPGEQPPGGEKKPPFGQPPKPEDEKTPAEKALGVVSDMVKLMTPTVVEVRPEVSVGDVVIHVPAGRNTP